MTRSALSFRTALLASAALLSGLPVLITAPIPAAAQQAPAARPFDIPAQPLAAAIAAYGRQSGVQVSLRAEDATGRTAAAVSGTLTAEAALTRLLQGTGLTAATATDGTVTLLPLPAAPAGAAVLAPLSVAGTVAVPGDSSPWEPTEGYTARRVATASKTDAPLIRTPQSVSVVTRDQIDAQKADSVVEALRYTPGVVGESFGIDTRYDWTLIRGFSQAETGLFRDGLQLRSTGYASWRQEPYGAERIEVLRGPASVLYGQGDVGGLVNTISKRPVDGQKQEVQVTVGSHNLFQESFDIGGRADDAGQVLFRVVGLRRDADTQVDHVRDERTYFAPSLTLKSRDDDTHLTLLASYQQDSTGSVTNFLPAAGTIRPGATGMLPTSFFTGDPNFDTYDKTQYSVGYDFDHRFNETFSVRQNARYAHLDLKYAALYGSGLDASDPSGTTLSRGALVADPTTDAFAVDTQGRAEFKTGPIGHDVLVGLDIQRNDFKTRTGFAWASAATALNLRNPVYGISVARPAYGTNDDVTQVQTGLYVQDQIALTDRLTVVAGGRHDWVDTSTDNHLTGGETSASDSAFTGKLGVVYEFPVGIAPYASYSESFRPTLESNKAGTPFDPEEGRQYEIGVKFQPPGQDSQITLAVFDLTKSNVVTTHPSDITDKVQTGEIRAQGFEASAIGKLTDELSVISSLTILDMEKTRSNNGDQGKAPTGVPKTTASLWGDYTVRSGPLSGFGFGAGVRYTGPTWGNTTNTLRLDSSWLADAALHYDITENARFALNASNLFNETVIAQCSSDSACYYGQDRVIKATLGYRW